MREPKSLLVTGGSGFIGSAFVRLLFGSLGFRGHVVNLDLLTYAGNPDNAGQTMGTTQILPRYWKDAGGVRASASYWFIPNVEGFAGVGFDSSAVRRQTLDAALLDTNKMSFSLGARWQIVRQFAMALTLTDIVYFKTDTKGQSIYAKVAGNASHVTQQGPSMGFRLLCENLRAPGEQRHHQRVKTRGEAGLAGPLHEADTAD